MPLHEEFERSGAWLFRWRSYVPMLLIVVILLALPGFTYPVGNHGLDQVWDFACLAVAFFGLAIRVYTVGHVPDRTSGRNTRQQVASELNAAFPQFPVQKHFFKGKRRCVFVGRVCCCLRPRRFLLNTRG